MADDPLARDVPLVRGLLQPRRHHSDLPARSQLPRPVRELELFVHQPWRIASRDRSSTTREYIGAVRDVEALRVGRGAFPTEEEFYRYWRAFPFRIPKAVERQLEKALAETTRERARAVKPKEAE
ncbi:MAG: type II restriction endonuclease [Acidimicrobiales bacterium]